MADAAALFLAKGKALSAKLPGTGNANVAPEKPAKRRGLYDDDSLETPAPHGQNRTF